MRTSHEPDLSVVHEVASREVGDEEDLQVSAPAAQSAPSDAPVGLAQALAAWRAELTGLGGPSPLLLPGDLQADALDLGHAHPSGIASFLAGRATRLSHLFREPGALDDARRRARSIRLASHALADEHGLRACVLAVGLASWRDPSGTVVSTPVLLRPLELRPRGSGAVDYELDLADPVRTNPALVRELRRRGVDVDATHLARLAQRQHGFDPAPSLERLRALTRSAAPGIEVRASLLITALVDVAPALVADLDREAPDLARSDVPLALAGDRGAVERLAVQAQRARDAHRGPALDEVRVLPLDPSQRAAVAGVLAGASLRVEAGPGTGATQVAAATVAALVGAGRRVLLVPGQQVEVEDVAARLAPLGLGHLVLGGPGREPDDRWRTGGLPAVGGGGRAPGQPAPGPAEELAAATTALHARRQPWGVSVLDAFAALTRLDAEDAPPTTAVTLPRSALAAMGGRERDRLGELLREAVELGALSVTAGDTPWSGADLTDPGEAEAALTTVAELRSQVLPDLRSQVRVISRATGLREPRSVAEADELLRLMADVRSTLDQFTPHVYDRPVTELVDATSSGDDRLARGVRMGLIARRRAERTAYELLRPGVVPNDLHEALLIADASRRAWLSWQLPETAGALPVVPRGLPQTEALFEAAAADLAALAPTLATTAGGGDLLAGTWEQLEERLAQLEQDAGALEVLPRRTALMVALRSAGLAPLLEDLRVRSVPAGRVAAELRRSWWISLLEAAIDDDPALGGLDASRRAELVTALRTAERRRTIGAAGLVADAAGHLARQGSPPCRVSSPLALPHEVPASEQHDVVLFLGAHRTGVPEAVLAMASAPQVVVIGDPGGLPVAHFSPRGTAVTGAPAPPPRTSVLEALAGRLPTQRLEEQHRMPAELASVAALVPGSATGRAGLPGVPGRVAALLSHVPGGTGAPDATGSVESPDGEVSRVVDLVSEHARDRPDLSLGVIALTRGHARRIADAVRAAYTHRPELHAFLGAGAGELEERFVVTDVERSGDTVRDAVIVTIGFGPTALGRFDHRLGPLDGPGGTRRLAVALTRARARTTLVTSVSSAQLEPHRLASAGGKALRAVVVALEERARTIPPTPEPRDALLARLLPELLGSGASYGASGEPGDDAAHGRVPGQRESPPAVRVWVPDGGVVDLLVTGHHAPSGAAAHAGVAVLTDLFAAGEGGRDGAVDPAAVVQREVALPMELARLGWRVARLGAVELFTDPVTAARRVREELERL